MIAVALIAVLVTQTQGGKMSVVDGLSDHACAEARCVALYGHSCEAQLAHEVAEIKRWREAREAWARAHPKQDAACKVQNADPRIIYLGKKCGPDDLYSGWVLYRTIEPDDIKSAQCVK